MYGGFPYADAPYADQATRGPQAQGAVSLPMFTAASQAQSRPHAAGAVTLPIFTPAGHGVAHVVSHGTVTLPALTAIGHAVVPVFARGAVLLPMLTTRIRIQTSARRSVRAWRTRARPASGFTVCSDMTVGTLREGDQDG